MAGGPQSLTDFAFGVPGGLQLLGRMALDNDENARVRGVVRTMFPQPADQAHYEQVFSERMAAERDVTHIENSIEPKVFLDQVVSVFTHYVTPAELQEIKAKVANNVLVVVGKMDVVINAANSIRMLNDMGFNPNDLLIFDDAGHGVYEQYADRVNARIEGLIVSAA
jgi:hypothetical protein